MQTIFKAGRKAGIALLVLGGPLLAPTLPARAQY